MLIQFSPEANMLLDEAKRYASTLGNPYVGVEHLFLAVLDTSDILRMKLTRQGINKTNLIEAVSKWSYKIESYQIEDAGIKIMPTPRLEKLIGVARLEAKKNGLSQITSELLFRSLLLEKSGVIPMILEGRDLSFESLLENHVLSKPLISYKPLKGVLGKLGRDLTQLAKEGKSDPVIGRKEEIKRVMQILVRKTKNNPVLIGEAGVGKTAVVLGLAQRIAAGTVPKQLVGRRIVEISVASLLAGMKHRGEFEERLQQLVLEVAKDSSIIIFIDEIHTIIGAGDPKGPMDMGNILKPVLARGEFPLIGATTNEEFQKYMANDAALERRFQPILVPEPSEAETMEIITGVLHKYEAHHGVKFREEALRMAISLSVRYLPERHLPDKALDLLDEAASRAKLRSVLSLSQAPTPVSNMSQSNAVLELFVDSELIAEVISLWTGVPLTAMTENESEKLAHLEECLKKRVVGQDEAVTKVAKTVKLMRLGLGAPERPSGVFLFLGPTGVGKTELAKALAQILFGSDKSLIRFDMSEYKEKHSIARLIGSPPGYVGYGEGGQLTKIVRARPYSIILLDEIEKADSQIFDLFLQVFDEGRLTDGQGQTVNFKNTIIIMTSNVGSNLIADNLSKEADANRELATIQAVNEAVNEELRKDFRPEFLNRIDEIIVFNPLREKELEKILDIQLHELKDRFNEKEIDLEVAPEAKTFLIKKGYEPAYGARPLRRAIENFLSKPLAETLINYGYAAIKENWPLEAIRESKQTGMKQSNVKQNKFKVTVQMKEDKLEFKVQQLK